MEGEEYDFEMIAVAIPLGQGQVFNPVFLYFY